MSLRRPRLHTNDAAWLTLLFAAGLVLTSSCSDTAQERGKLATLSQGCSINSDCTSPLSCTFGRCHEQCTESRDCPPGLRCVNSAGGGVCQLQDEVQCDLSNLCPGDQTCASDLECRDPCAGQSCLPNQVCADGACADPEELVNGHLPKPDGGVAGAGGAGGSSGSGGTGGTVTCGGATCSTYILMGLATLPACCGAKNKCGSYFDGPSSALLSGIPNKCYEATQPGVRDCSCPAWANQNPFPPPDQLVFPGCCTATGKCGYVMDLTSKSGPDIGCEEAFGDGKGWPCNPASPDTSCLGDGGS